MTKRNFILASCSLHHLSAIIMRPTRILRQKNLLLAFDAFGTLYKPFKPIAEQYADAARRYGIAGVDQPSLKESFETVYRAQMKENPNYGKETGMGPAQWWRNVCQKFYKLDLSPRFADECDR